MMLHKLSFAQCARLLWLRSLGCLVEYPEVSQVGKQLRIEAVPTYLETDLYPVPDGTAIAIWLEIRTAVPLTVHSVKFWTPAARGLFSLLEPSEKHPNHYCLPPEVWINGSDTLNHHLVNGSRLQRNALYQGFLLGTIPDRIPASVGEQLEAVVSIEDWGGHDYSFVTTLIHRPVDPKVLREYSEEATFPPPKKRKKRKKKHRACKAANTADGWSTACVERIVDSLTLAGLKCATGDEPIGDYRARS